MNINRSLSFDKSIVKPDAISAKLDELIKRGNKEIKKEIALHPNTPSKTLVKLFRDHSEQVLNHPTLSLILLENPDFLEKLFNESSYYWNSLSKFPQFFIEWAVNHPQVSIRSKIAGNHYIPISFLNKLAQDIDKNVRVSVAGTLCISDRNFEWLHEEKAINRTVNNHSDAAFKIIGQLAQDKDMNVRYVVANNTGTPIYILEQLSFDPHWQVREAVARNRQTPKTVLRRLFQSENKSIVESIARNRNIPNDLMEICAGSENYRFRYFIADNSSTSKTILTKLAFDRDISVRQQVANNPNTPPKIIEQLGKENVRKEDIPF